LFVASLEQGRKEEESKRRKIRKGKEKKNRGKWII
jgi:hypothetical protein